MRFSLKWFLAGVAFVALVTAALIWPFGPLPGILVGVVCASILATAITAVAGASGPRAFAFGYFLVTTSYFALLSVYPSSSPFLNSAGAFPHLIDKYIATPIHIEIAPILMRQIAEPGQQVQRIDDQTYAIGPRRYGAMNHFEGTSSTMQLAFTVVLGFIGGWFSLRTRTKTG